MMEASGHKDTSQTQKGILGWTSNSPYLSGTCANESLPVVCTASRSVMARAQGLACGPPIACRNALWSQYDLRVEINQLRRKLQNMTTANEQP